MPYAGLRKLLFLLDPEVAHHVSLNSLNIAYKLGLLNLVVPKVPANPVKVMGLTFPNPVGLAAGLDKNGDFVDALGALGFGFVEIGTLTPRPQPGNPKPRLFRLPEHEAIINRMGFNNQGIDHGLKAVANRKFTGPLGINVGKNFDTPVERANDDYLIGIEKAYSYADYITVNVSSPNTPGLRTLQFGDSLDRLLDAIKNKQVALQGQYGRYVPIAIKIAPDMESDDIKLIADALRQFEMDAVIATNTTIGRESIKGHVLAQEQGGLSGLPVQAKSTQVIRALAEELNGAMPIIGVGGINDGASAAEKMKAGASLVQIYTGFIYKGPSLIREACEAIRELGL